MTTKLKNYSTTPGSNNSATPNGWPEGMLPSDVNNCAREMQARLREWYEDAEWLDLNHAAICTSGSGTQFVLTGNLTSFYTVGRALRFNGTTYAYVTSSSFGGASTVVNLAGATLGAIPTTIELGIASSLSLRGLVQNSTSQWAGTAGGTADALTGALSPTLLAYQTGLVVRILPAIDNNTAATLNIDSLGAKSIKKRGSLALDPADLKSGVVASLQYDGTNFQLLNPLSGYFDVAPIMRAVAINEAQGSDIASAATINLDTATGNTVDVTGTTGITAVTLSQGRRRLVRFTGILTITASGSLILPGSVASLTTAAGDFIEFVGYAAGVVRARAYQPASGATPIAEGFPVATLTDGASIAWNAQVAQSAQVTLGGNRALANPTNTVNGLTYILVIKQDATGSRTLSYGSNFKFPFGIVPTLSTAANAIDVLTCVANNGLLLSVLQKGFA